MIPSTITCPVHHAEPGLPCSLLVPICDARIAASCNELVDLFRSLASTAIEAEQRRREAEERTGPLDHGVAMAPVVEEES